MTRVESVETGLTERLFEDLSQACGDDCVLVGLKHEDRDEKALVARPVDARRYDRGIAVG